MSGLPEARAAVPVAQVQTGETNRPSSDTCWTTLSCSTSFSTLQVVDRAEHLGSGLLQRGLKAGTDTFVGIFAQNRPEVTSRPSESPWLRCIDVDLTGKRTPAVDHRRACLLYLLHGGGATVRHPGR